MSQIWRSKRSATYLMTENACSCILFALGGAYSPSARVRASLRWWIAKQLRPFWRQKKPLAGGDFPVHTQLPRAIPTGLLAAILQLAALLSCVGDTGET